MALNCCHLKGGYIMQNIIDQLTIFVAEWGLKVIGAIVILIAGKFIAGLLRKLVVKLLTKSKTDPTVISFAGNLVYFLILIFTVVASIGKLGVPMTSFIAIIGAAGLAIAFAMQGSLANFAAGVLILVFRPFKLGDVITAAGVTGSVKEIQIFETILATPDNIRITVPNGKIYGDVIKNISAYDTRRVDITVGISYDSSMKKAQEILEGLCKDDTRVLEDPAPTIAVAELADSSVNFVVRPWTKKEDYWAVKFDLTRQIKESFDANGIEIPFPQQVVHMITEKQAD